jgi:hypothetical protein
VVTPKNVAVFNVTRNFKRPRFQFFFIRQPSGIRNIDITLGFRRNAFGTVFDRNDHVAYPDSLGVSYRAGGHLEAVAVLKWGIRGRYGTGVVMDSEVSGYARSRIEKMEDNNRVVPVRTIPQFRQFAISRKTQGYIGSLTSGECPLLLVDGGRKKATLYGSYRGIGDYRESCDDVEYEVSFRQLIGFALTLLAIASIALGIARWNVSSIFLFAAAQVLVNLGIGLMLPADMAQFTLARFLPWPFSPSCACF